MAGNEYEIDQSHLPEVVIGVNERGQNVYSSYISEYLLPKEFGAHIHEYINGHNLDIGLAGIITRDGDLLWTLDPGYGHGQLASIQRRLSEEQGNKFEVFFEILGYTDKVTGEKSLLIRQPSKLLYLMSALQNVSSVTALRTIVEMMQRQFPELFDLSLELIYQRLLGRQVCIKNKLNQIDHII